MNCDNCERCNWNPGRDCGIAEHPHCEKCGHCLGRHVPRSEEQILGYARLNYDDRAKFYDPKERRAV